MSRRRNQQAPVPSIKRPPAPRGLPWGKLFLLGLVGLLAVAWFTPTIVMQTRLRDVVLRRVPLSAGVGWVARAKVRRKWGDDSLDCAVELSARANRRTVVRLVAGKCGTVGNDRLNEG